METQTQKNIVRLTASAKRALAEETVRMIGRPESDVAVLMGWRSDRLLAEFEEIQTFYVSVPTSEWFGQNRPVWKIDPQELWDLDAAHTARVAESNKATALLRSPQTMEGAQS